MLCGPYRFDLGLERLARAHPRRLRAPLRGHATPTTRAAGPARSPSRRRLRPSPTRCSSCTGGRDRLIPAHHAATVGRRGAGSRSWSCTTTATTASPIVPFECRSLIADWLAERIAMPRRRLSAMPDTDIESAIALTGHPDSSRQGVDANDFRRVTGGARALGRAGSTPGAPTVTCTPSWPRRPSATATGFTAGQAWVQAALSYHFAKFVWVLDMASSTAQAKRQGQMAALRRAHRHSRPHGRACRRPVPGDHQAGRQPAPAGTGSSEHALVRPAAARPGLDQGGVLPLGRTSSSEPRARDLFARRPRSRRVGL